ncbi:hypothetical protein FXO38_20994 [Capsicum annuum]|uniref:Uncharacterized protein n=1 Tax=Capsicum annuum TaxID=4072 RepID=A0A2G2Y1Z9_CAPAN|nr:hypothetical protein FXO38_20994 [Capsicum annuum]KAF3645566.1 hypothetical protein FXO37_20891 [Capsicum annuum]PHT63786.1 hypothetical protein T459_32315 [Capsicum annuum]
MAKKNFLPIVICIFLFVNLCLATEVDTDSFSNDEIDTAETNMELDWWFGWYRDRWFHPWPFAHPPKPAGGFRHKFPHWPFVHPPKPAGGFRHKFPYHPWPFMHPPKPSKVQGEKN